MFEMLYPVMIDRQEIETDSMGHGNTMGGAGVRFVLRPYRTGMDCHLTGDGAANPPFGVFGGTPGIGGGNYREDLQSGHRTYCSRKGYLEIAEGQIWTGVSSGGGGYGDLLERDVELIRCHVRDEIISLATARDIYGVVLDPDTLAVDQEATVKLREKIAAERGPLSEITPTKPGAATWLQEHIREGDEYLLDPQP